MKSPSIAFILLALLPAACTPAPHPASDAPNPEDAATARSMETDRQLALETGQHNESAWALTLQDPAQAPLLALARAHEALLLHPPDYLPAPRFTQTLALSDEPTLRLSRAQLLAEIRSQLAPLRHVHREPSYPGAPDTPETLAAAETRLTRCDLLNLLLLLHWLAQPATPAAILRLGTADRADTTTEYGGLLTPPTPPSTTLELTLMPPMFTGSDQAYISSDATIARVPTALALFHFHFHQIDNAENAGPGIGDLTFARLNRTTCLVFTNLSPTSFDADYYNPDGAVVDLGVYHVGD